MRSPLILITLLYVCLFGSQAWAAPSPALRRRDDPAPPPQSPSPPPAAASSGSPPADAKDVNTFAFPALTTASVSASPTKQAGAAVTAVSSQQSNGNATTPASAAPAAATNSATDATSTPADNADSDNKDSNGAGPVLPLQPSLSAVWVVAGILLLFSGLIYTFVGIKHKQIQVFLSAAFTASLGITVLIIYVMNPPVSDGTQGAYLAGILFPGLVLGALSVVFKDVTEGLGCGVGGFALSMWLLCLKSGGLIPSNAGKVVLLCVLTVAIFALSFSHHTRTYGLIFATAFGGAMILMLGIDCFTKVGLKEFWPYIWGVNDKIFPLGTTTYPLTKGMIAELSAVPILALFGIFSQMKIWSILQKKRERRAEEEAEKARLRDLEESQRGKNLMVQTEAEKMIWEQTYTESRPDLGTHSDSGIGSEASSSDKGSVKAFPNTTQDKIPDTVVEVYEMHGTSTISRDVSANSRTPHIVVSVADEVEREKVPDVTDDQPQETSASHSQRFSFEDEEEDKNEVPATVENEASWMESLKGMSLKPKSVAPVVVPLPFSVGDDEASENEDDDRSSVATAATSGIGSKRQSMLSTREEMIKNVTMSHKKQPSETSSVEVMAASPVTDSFEEDSTHLSNTSSVANLSERAEPVPDIKDESGLSRRLVPEQSLQIGSAASERNGNATNADANISSDRAAVSTAPETYGAEQADVAERTNAVPVSRPEIPPRASASRLSKAVLPDNVVSKTLHKYRTNEWAKHIGDAGVPEEDEIDKSSPPSPCLPVDADTLAPVSQGDAALTPDEVQPGSSRSSIDRGSSLEESAAMDGKASKAAWHKRTSLRQSSSPSMPLSPESKISLRQSMTPDGRSASRMSTMRSSSNSRARSARLRQSSQPLVTSPIEEDVEATFSPQSGRSSTLPTAAPTLLDHREAMVSQSSLTRSQSQASVHKVPITNAMYNASRSSTSLNSVRPVSQMTRRNSNPEELRILNRQASMASMTSLRSSSQPYSPPAPVRTYSQASNLGGPVAVSVSPSQPITHLGSVAPPDRPLHHRSNTPNMDAVAQRMAAWRSGLQNDSMNRRTSSMAHVDTDNGAAATMAGSQWLAQQRQSRQMELANKQAAEGYAAGNGFSSPAPVTNSSGYFDPRASALVQSQAHQDVMRRMQSKAKLK